MSPRRTVAEARQTRAGIVRHGVDVASVEGLEGITIGRLAADLGMSKSGILGHFGDKETLQLAVHSPLTRALHHSSYTFLKRLSHTADSQDQRHRMVPASRPLMTMTDTARPDHVTPPLIAADPRALAVYQEAMAAAWAAKNRLLELGVPLESALYVLPNAKALRFHESGSLLYLAHKWVMRTCFNAQEEIYRASMDELEQIRAVHPRLVRHMGPPCVLRHGRITPTCTEGEHFCGVPVWRNFPDVVRPL